MMNNMIIASSRQNRLSSWKAGLDGFVNTVLVVDKLTTLSNEVIRLRPKVLLLDFDLVGSNNLLGLRNICAETRTIVIGAISEEMEWELLKVGVRGCCA